MRLPFPALIALTVVACGGGSEPRTPVALTAPSPAPLQPSPSLITIDGMITDTVTGAIIGSFTHTAASLPARVSVSATGYITRETDVRSATPTVDLFPERGFDLGFYRQLARDDLQRGAGPLQPLWVLNEAPSFYLEVEGAKGVATPVGQRLEAVARRTVPSLTGGRFQVTRWETGPTPRAPQPGWIMIERADLGPEVCGRARIGAVAGQIWLHTDNVCNLEGVFAHEIGHALGFFHVNLEGSLMFPQARRSNIADAATERERHHTHLAYSRPRGNADIDVDPQAPLTSEAAIVID